MVLGITHVATDRFLASIDEWLATQVPSERLPKGILGCGHYGCVYETMGDPNVVLKVTTDPTEVFFVQEAVKLAYWPEGIVKYFQILRAPDQSYRKRDVYLIWREAAEHVGKTLNYPSFGKLTYDESTRRNAWYRLNQFKRYAHELRTALQRTSNPKQALCTAKERYEDWAREYISELDWDRLAHQDWIEGTTSFSRFRGPQRIAYLIRACYVTAEFMENEPVLDQVGYALKYYLEQGLLLADVHAGNIGRVYREGGWHDVITDPGHALDLRDLASC